MTERSSPLAVSPGASRNVSDMGIVTKFDPDIADALAAEDISKAISYADPTGEKAIRWIALKMGVDFGRGHRPGSKVQVRIDGDLLPQPNGEMRRTRTPVTLDEALTEALFIVLAQIAEYEPTGSGNGYRASLKKNTPAFASLFGDTREVEGSEKS